MTPAQKANHLTSAPNEILLRSSAQDEFTLLMHWSWRCYCRVMRDANNVPSIMHAFNLSIFFFSLCILRDCRVFRRRTIYLNEIDPIVGCDWLRQYRREGSNSQVFIATVENSFRRNQNTRWKSAQQCKHVPANENTQFISLMFP